MNASSLLAAAMLTGVLVVHAPSASAQQATGDAGGTAAPVVELKKNPLELLRELEPPADAPYELGKGDVITVTVAGRPEASGQHTVGPDGEITLPLVGSIMVLNKTREQSAAEIQKAMSNYYENVTIFVGVEKYTSNRISVIGAVQHQGTMSFDGTPLLLDAISRAGTVSQAPTSSVQSAATIAPAYPDECIIYRGKDIVFTVQLRQLLEENNNLADYRLKRDDIVYVPGITKYVSILGQVLHPGTQQLRSTSTLTELIADAGGITNRAGRSPVVQILHKGNGTSPGRVQVVAYKDLLAGKPVDTTLRSGDVLFVPESGFNSVAYTIEKLAPLVNLVTVGAILR